MHVSVRSARLSVISKKTWNELKDHDLEYAHPGALKFSEQSTDITKPMRSSSRGDGRRGPFTRGGSALLLREEADQISRKQQKQLLALGFGLLIVFCAVVYCVHESDKEARAQEVSTILQVLQQERNALESLMEENT